MKKIDLKKLKFSDLDLLNLYTLPVSEILAELIPLKSTHFAINSRSSKLLAVCSNSDVLYYLNSGQLSDPVESILSLDVENENYLVYYQQNDDYILPACQKFAKNLHRAVIESPQGFKLATQIDILKAVLGDERLNLNISEFFKENLKSSLELISIRSGTSLQKALGEMMESNLPCLPVLDDGKLIGCLCPLAVSRLDPKHFKEQLLAPVDDLVKGLVTETVTESDTLTTVIQKMVKSGDSRVFITKNDKISSVVSASDIIKVLISFE